jgi:hypothetical protein
MGSCSRRGAGVLRISSEGSPARGSARSGASRNLRAALSQGARSHAAAVSGRCSDSGRDWARRDYATGLLGDHFKLDFAEAICPWNGESGQRSCSCSSARTGRRRSASHRGRDQRPRGLTRSFTAAGSPDRGEARRLLLEHNGVGESATASASPMWKSGTSLRPSAHPLDAIASAAKAPGGWGEMISALARPRWRAAHARPAQAARASR